MSWTIKFVSCLLLTSVTGSIMFAVWYIAGRWLEQAGFLNILYSFMKLIMIFFAVPGLYIAMVLLDQAYGAYRGDLFLHTMTLMTICDVLFALWTGIAAFILVKQMRLVHRTGRMFKDCFPCERHTEEIFRQIGKKMRIPKGRVGLARCYGAPTAVIFGVLRPMVILPAAEYTDEELEVIFVHELTHYKHKDILWRRIASALVGIHFFNPMIWKFHALLGKWGEYACDFEACDASGGIKHYFNTIVKIQVNTGGTGAVFAASLSENENELAERVIRMKRQKGIKKRSARKAAVICMAMLLSSSATVYAASEGLAATYHAAYDATVIDIEEDRLPEPPEYEESGEAEGIVEEVGEVNELSRSTKAFTWTVANGVRKTTSGFSAKSGGHISVNVSVVPTGKTVRAGIIEPNGNRRYTSGKEYLSKTFALDQTGTYKVYVENNSGAKVTVEGNYMTY